MERRQSRPERTRQIKKAKKNPGARRWTEGRSERNDHDKTKRAEDRETPPQQICTRERRQRS